MSHNLPEFCSKSFGQGTELLHSFYKKDTKIWIAFTGKKCYTGKHGVNLHIKYERYRIDRRRK